MAVGTRIDYAMSLQTAVLEQLAHDRARARTIEDIARFLGVPRRDVEQALQDLADSGEWPICASSRPPYGVWLGSPAEVREYLERLDSRVRTQLRRRHGLRRWLQSGSDPLVLFPDLEATA